MSTRIRTRSQRHRGTKGKLRTIIAALVGLFVFAALVDSADTGIRVDASAILTLAGHGLQTVLLWAAVIACGPYLLYLAAVKLFPQMRKDHDERASKRIRKWGLIGAAALTALAYALYFLPILIGRALAWAGARTSEAASGLDGAAHAVAARLPVILFTVAVAAYLLAGYLWAVRGRSKGEQLARGGLVYGPLAVLTLALEQAGVIG
ncbi:DUF4153 domain-containing protein [Glycomyces xiaoerkulensis]|uniref:DUF4153 domain-containing protein n=1 Tax=Glycomyces xiaoerkulensis TaxID=2038139 RepID=UPI000C268774|nr:DUF4153 domain-containing protein [Glycomyces xiaoerkulensis]